MEIICPYCGENVGYHLPESFKGNVSCCWCPHTFSIEIEKGEIKKVTKKPLKE